MNRFLEIITSFPTVIFTVAVLVSLGYWIISTLLGLDDSAIDADIDADFDVDIEADLEVGAAAGHDGVDVASGAGAQGFGDSILMGLGLHLMPLSLVITVVSLAAWLASVIMTVAIGSANFLVGIAVFIGALFVGVLASGRVARLIAPLFRVTRAAAHKQLIGRLCVLRTGRVDAGFGQAEVTDAEGGSHLIQVRCHISNRLKAGDTALVVDVEDGVFVVSPDVEALKD